MRVVAKCHQGGEELEDDRGVDGVHLLPYGVRDPIGAGGRGGGAFGEGVFDFFFREGGGGRVLGQASSAREGGLRGEEVVQECIVDRDGIICVWEGGKSGGLSRSDQLFGCPDVIGGRFCEEVRPVGGSGPFNGLEVADLGLPRCGVGVGVPQLLGLAGGSREFFSESGEERSPPGLGPGGGA